MRIEQKKYLIGVPLGLLVAWIIFWGVFRLGYNAGVKFANESDEISRSIRPDIASNSVSTITSPANTNSTNNKLDDENIDKEIIDTNELKKCFAVGLRPNMDINAYLELLLKVATTPAGPDQEYLWNKEYRKNSLSYFIMVTIPYPYVTNIFYFETSPSGTEIARNMSERAAKGMHMCEIDDIVGLDVLYHSESNGVMIGRALLNRSNIYKAVCDFVMRKRVNSTKWNLVFLAIENRFNSGLDLAYPVFIVDGPYGWRGAEEEFHRFNIPESVMRNDPSRLLFNTPSNAIPKTIEVP